MIKGIVTARREAIVGITLCSPTGPKLRVDAVIDTGYTGCLCLPARTIVRMGFAWRRRSTATLADGSVSLFNVYDGTVLWDGHRRSIPIDEVGAECLVGMEFLDGHELKMEIHAGGKVAIKRLPRRRRP
jgi:clan AA aspartic protease